MRLTLERCVCVGKIQKENMDSPHHGALTFAISIGRLFQRYVKEWTVAQWVFKWLVWRQGVVTMNEATLRLVVKISEEVRIYPARKLKTELGQ
jgi:hypothetical protein